MNIQKAKREVRVGLIIGPSLGWFWATEKKIPSLPEQEAVLIEAGANCAEYCLAGWGQDERMKFLRSGHKMFGAKTFLSIHLPDVDGTNSAEQIGLAQNAIQLFGANVAVTHPLKHQGEYPIQAYRMMIAAGVHLNIENMDRTKNSGIDISELSRLVEATGCGFTLDIQHGSEHGDEYLNDLIASVGGAMTHLHVSGGAPGNHILAHLAENAAKIVKFVGLALERKRVPLILEGEYHGAREIQREIEFWIRELA